MLIDEDVRQGILAPIDGDVGIDGRGDEGAAGDLLREIRSQRKSIARAEQAAAIDEDVVLPDDVWDWETVGRNACEYLMTYGKDLEPLATLLEASAREEGPQDLASGMTLLADFVEAFWDLGMYPAEDEDGVETRFQPISGLSGGSNDKDGALILPLRRLILVEVRGTPLRYIDKVMADAKSAAAQSGDSDQRASRAEEADAAFRGFEKIARDAKRADLDEALASITIAETEWRRAIDFICDRAKPAMPAASRVSTELKNIREWLAALIAQLPVAESADAAAAETSDGDAQAVAAPSGGGAPAAGGFVAGRITRREDALRAITAASEYFLEQEPLSPIGTTLREVDRRARLSLHALLSELIPDESSRNNFYWRAGIKPPAEESSDW